MPTATQTSSGTSRRRARQSSDLVSLAAPVLELVLKLQAGIVAPSNDLRKTVAQLLEDMEKRAAVLRHSERQVRDVKFALAAFVDETVMTANFPLKEEWEKNPLQLEYFGEHLAGVKFFEKLDELIKHIQTEADVVEVYYVCMLLGFKGKYKVYTEDQLKDVIRATADQLRAAGRLQEGDLSPHWRVLDRQEPRRDPGLPLWAKIGAGVFACLAILIYMVLIFLLKSDVNAAKEQLLH